MDFEEAKQAHFDWKRKLSVYLRKPDGSLSSETVAQDNKCLLGQWIYGEGKKLEVHEEYSKLKREHARFHKAAADVIKKADSGANVTEDVAIGTKSEFGEASVAVIVAINEIKRKVSK